MRIIDITTELTDRTITYKRYPRVRLEPHATIESDGYNCTRISMGSHSGTHMDAPCHVYVDGKAATDISLNLMIGQCYVVDVDNFKIPPNAKRILIKGSMGQESTINLRQAQALLEAGIRLLGTDALSIGNDEVHQLVLGEDCVVLEALDLTNVQPGKYTLCALPLKIACDAAPVRACLLQQREAIR